MTTVIESDNILGNPDFSNPTKIERWESDWITMVADSSGNIPLPRSAFDGQAPDRITLEVKLSSAGGDYAAGDVIYINQGSYDNPTPSTGRYGITVSLNDANDEFYYKIAEDGYYLWSTIGGTFLITPNADFRIVATKFTLGDVPDITRVGLVPLEKKVVTSGDADVQFNLEQYFNEYEDFEVDYKDLQNLTNNVDLQTRFSADGSTFLSGASDYNDSYLAVLAGLVRDGAGTTTYAYGSVFTTGTALGQTARGTIKIDGAADPNERTALRGFIYGRNPTPADWAVMFGSNRNTEEVTKAIQFFASSGNLGSGTFILYGKRKVP